MPKATTRRTHRRTHRRAHRKYKRGGDGTPDIEMGPIQKDVTPYEIGPDPKRGEDFETKFIQEKISEPPLTSTEITQFFDNEPPEQSERRSMASEDIASAVAQYQQPMGNIFKGGKKTHRHRRRGRKSKRKSHKSRRH